MRRSPGTGSVYQPRYRGADGTLRKSRLYWIAYRVGAELRREPTKTADKRAAEGILRARLVGLDRGELPTTDRATWEQLVAGIRTDYRAHGRRSAARLEVSLKHLDGAFGGLHAAAITADRVSAYVTMRLDEGAARASVNRELAALKRAFRLAHRAGRVLVLPWVATLDEHNARTGFFERPDFGRLVRALPRDLRACAIIAYITGWRMVSEILTRRWPHLDLRAGWLRLEPGEPKTGEGRQFPLFPELRRVLRWQARARLVGVPWIFHHEGAPLFYRAKKGGLLPSAYLRASWLAACKAAGLPGAIRHDFRRTAARDLLRSGVSVPVVMRAMGWRNEAMLRRYAIVAEQDLQEAGAKRARLRR